MLNQTFTPIHSKDTSRISSTCSKTLFYMQVVNRRVCYWFIGREVFFPMSDMVPKLCEKPILILKPSLLHLLTLHCNRGAASHSNISIEHPLTPNPPHDFV